MLLPREFVSYLSRQIVRRLVPQTVESRTPEKVAELVNGIILALGLTLCVLISDRRSRAASAAPQRTARDLLPRAALTGTVVVVALLVLDLADHALLVWPENIAHHTSNPSPPLFGIVSILGCLAGIAFLGITARRRRAAARRLDQQPAQTDSRV